MSKTKISAYHSTTPVEDRNEWGTPLDLFAELHKKFKFTVDAFASDKNALLKKYWTKEDSAYLNPWANERVFFNPHYSRGEIEKACGKARNAGGLAVGLIKVDTSVKWWREVKKAEYIYQIPFRLKFRGADHVAPFASALVYYGVVPGVVKIDEEG